MTENQASPRRHLSAAERLTLQSTIAFNLRSIADALDELTADELDLSVNSTPPTTGSHRIQVNDNAQHTPRRRFNFNIFADRQRNQPNNPLSPQNGQRVRITRGANLGKTGTITGPRGTYYWYIRLDDGRTIYKQPQNFRPME